MSSIQVIKENSLGINRGLYGATFGNSLTPGQISTLLSEQAAVSVGTDARDIDNKMFGPVAKHWGPATGKSNLPKVAGTFNYLFGDCENILVNGANGKIRATAALIHGVGENMRAINNGFTNGFGDFKAAVIVNGVSYPGVVVDTLDKDYAVLTAANMVNGNPRIGRCSYGDVLTFEFDINGQYLPPGSAVRYKLTGVQTAHNDNGGGTFGVNQFMSYNAQNKSNDVFVRNTNGSSVTPANWQAWLDAVDTVDPTTTLPGGTTGQVGIRFFNLYTETTNPTFAVPGDSKEHGQDDGSTSNYDPGLDIYGLNGETANILGYQYGIANLGMQTEKGSDITDISKYGGRAKLAKMCTNGVWGYFYNDIGLGGAWAEETNVLAAAQSVFNTVTALIPHIKNWIMKTITPSVTSGDYLTSYSAQNPIYNPRITNILNGAMRRGLFGNAGFIDAEFCVTPAQGSGLIEIPSNTVVVNSGTGSITVNAASGTTPATTILNASTAPFKREHNNMHIVIPGVGSSGGVLRAQMQYIDASNARLIIRRSGDAPLAIPQSFLNSASPMALTFSTNNLYIGAEDLIETSGSSYIHFGRRGERLMGQRCRSRSPIVLI